MIRDIPQAAPQDIMPPIKRVHVELQENADIKEILNASSLDLKYGKDILTEWSSFNLTKVNGKLGNPKLISLPFLNMAGH
mgnify:FL=1